MMTVSLRDRDGCSHFRMIFYFRGNINIILITPDPASLLRVLGGSADPGSGLYACAAVSRNNN